MLVDFYHLASSPLERVLPRICERVVGEGQRLLIVADAGLLPSLDRQLWSYARDSFLPHGLATDARAETQPILLSAQAEPLNGARNIALADGQWRDEALSFDRTFFLFDGGKIEEARTSWRTLSRKAEVECRYWKQNDAGKWVQGP
jgi:DNA polymerase-3 subunit chi